MDERIEKIAQKIFQGVKDSEGEFTLGNARILAREIRQLFEPKLDEKVRERGCVKLADDQSCPPVPDNFVEACYTYLASQADMLQVGFRKVKFGRRSNGR